MLLHKHQGNYTIAQLPTALAWFICVMSKYQITLKHYIMQRVDILYNRNGNQFSFVSPVTAYISLKLRDCCNKINSSKIRLQYRPCKNMFIHHIHFSCQVFYFFKEHIPIIAILCEKIQYDQVNEKLLRNKQYFVCAQIGMDFRQLSLRCA